MKAVEEVGFGNIVRFVFYNITQVLYGFLMMPPLRKLFLGFLGANIGDNSIIMNVKFFNWHHIGQSGFKIGKECFIGDETLIDLYDKVILEDQVTIAQRVTILTHLNVGYKNHPLQKFFPKMTKPVVFKAGCVVAAASTILPGVIIGRESFVAAGSVVTRDVAPRTLVAGVPAKVVRKIK